MSAAKIVCASALAAVRNANFFISASRAIADFETRDSRYNRAFAAKAADRISVIVAMRVVNAQRVAQLAFVMPPLAICALVRLMPRIGAPTAHVESVIPATLCEHHLLHPLCTRIISRRDGRETGAVHRSPPGPRSPFSAAAAGHKPSRRLLGIAVLLR